jgi:hypothetical protein
VTSERDKTREHLETLRRRRAGERVSRVRDSEEEEDYGLELGLIGQPGLISDEDSLHSSTDAEAELAEDADMDADVDVDESDFIVEDDSGGRLARPHPDIPLEFTHFASSKPKELFPHVIEWLVKNKLAPAFDRDDALYRLAWSKLDDQVKGQAGSRLISAAWNAMFKYTILARPQIAIDTLPGMDEDLLRSCDACNKAQNPARYDFVLSGTAYYKNSLEPIDHSEDEGDINVDYDEHGRALAPVSHHFYLGSHCAANAQMGHKLSHWKYHLNESVLQYLEEQNVLSTDAIVAREKMNKRSREKQAEAIVDSMEATGKIAELWKEFQNDLDDARIGMEDYQKQGGRSKGRVGIIRSVANGLVRAIAETPEQSALLLLGR